MVRLARGDRVPLVVREAPAPVVVGERAAHRAPHRSAAARAGGHAAPPIASVWVTWNTVAPLGLLPAGRTDRSPVVASTVSRPCTGTHVRTRTPCSPFRTDRPRAFHAQKVRTFT